MDKGQIYPCTKGNCLNIPFVIFSVQIYLSCYILSLNIPLSLYFDANMS